MFLGSSGISAREFTHTKARRASYQGARLKHGYIVGAGGVELGLTPTNTVGFAFISLERNESSDDWLQPLASYGVSGVSVSPTPLAGDLPLLVDTGIHT
jgi:hypothetical protein